MLPETVRGGGYMFILSYLQNRHRLHRRFHKGGGRCFQLFSGTAIDSAAAAATAAVTATFTYYAVVTTGVTTVDTIATIAAVTIMLCYPMVIDLNLEGFEKDKPDGDWPFREVVGGLTWLGDHTRPGISNAVRAVSMRTHALKSVHWKAALTFKVFEGHE